MQPSKKIENQMCGFRMSYRKEISQRISINGLIFYCQPQDTFMDLVITTYYNSRSPPKRGIHKIIDITKKDQ